MHVRPLIKSWDHVWKKWLEIWKGIITVTDKIRRNWGCVKPYDKGVDDNVKGIVNGGKVVTNTGRVYTMKEEFTSRYYIGVIRKIMNTVKRRYNLVINNEKSKKCSHKTFERTKDFDDFILLDTFW